MAKKHQIRLKHLEEKKNVEERSIFVLGTLQNLRVPELALAEYFGKYSSPSSIVVDKNDAKFAIIKFEDANVVKDVLKQKNHIIDGIKVLIKPRLIKSKYEEESKKKSFITDDLKNKLLNCTNMSEQAEILQNELKLNSDEIKLRQQVCNSLTKSLQTFFPGSKMIIFGSSVNGLGTHDCDLDLHFESPLSNSSASNSHQDLFIAVSEFIKNCVLECEDVKTINQDRFQLIRFHHKPSHLHCDLSFANKLGVRNTHLQQAIFSSNPHFLSLVFLIRIWARHHHLTGAHGLTSFATTLLVIFFLQKTKRIPNIQDLSLLSSEKIRIRDWECSFPSSIPPAPHEQIQQLLKDFFSFYSKINFGSKLVLDLNIGDITDTSGPQLLTTCGQLNVRDPFELTRNVTSNVSRKMVFNLSRNLRQARRIVNQKRFASREGVWGVLQLLPTSLSCPSLPGTTCCLSLPTTDPFTPSAIIKTLRDIFHVRCLIDGDDDVTTTTTETTAALWCGPNGPDSHGAVERGILSTSRKRAPIDDPSSSVKKCKLSLTSSKSAMRPLSLPLLVSCEVDDRLWVGRRKLRRRLEKNRQWESRTDEFDLEQRISALLIADNKPIAHDSSVTSSETATQLAFEVRMRKEKNENLELKFELKSPDLREDFINFFHHLEIFLPNFLQKSPANSHVSI